MKKRIENLILALLFAFLGFTNACGQKIKLDSILYVADSIFLTSIAAVEKLQKGEPDFTSKYTLVVKNLDGDTKNIMQNDNYHFSFFNLERGDSIWLFFPEGQKERYFTYSNNISYTNRAAKMQIENTYIDTDYDFEKDSFLNPCGVKVALDDGEGTKWAVASYRFAKTVNVDNTGEYVETSLQSHKDINVSLNTFKQLNFFHVVLINESRKAFERNGPINVLNDPEQLKHSLSGRSFSN